MPKHAIRVPAVRGGRRVRWMFEVSTDVGEDIVQIRKTSKKPARSKRKTKPSRAKSQGTPLLTAAAITPSTARPSTAMLAPAVRVGPPPPQAAAMPPLTSRTTGREMLVMVVLGVVVVVGGTMALMGYASSRRVASEARDVSAGGNTSSEAPAPPIQVATPVHDAAPAPAVVATARAPKAVGEKPSQTPVATTRSSPAGSVSSPPVVTAGAPAGPPVPDTTASQQSTSAPAITATTDVMSEAVTISGCLEMTIDGDEFRLTDTEGTDAPKARSWRSGFLKKRSAPVELVELSDALSLRRHVGHRVMATGQLTGRELRLRSLQPAGSSCD